jgi:hypothetical protein
MCHELNYKEKKQSKYRICAKCKKPFKLYSGGYSQYKTCLHHGKIINGKCVQCDKKKDNYTCLCIAEVTWWEKITGKL